MAASSFLQVFNDLVYSLKLWLLSSLIPISTCDQSFPDVNILLAWDYILIVGLTVCFLIRILVASSLLILIVGHCLLSSILLIVFTDGIIDLFIVNFSLFLVVIFGTFISDTIGLWSDPPPSHISNVVGFRFVRK